MRRSCGSYSDVTTPVHVTCPAAVTCRLCLRLLRGRSHLQTEISEDVAHDLGLCMVHLAIKSIPDSDFNLAMSVSIDGHGGKHETTEECWCHDAACFMLLGTGKNSGVSALFRTRALAVRLKIATSWRQTPVSRTVPNGHHRRRGKRQNCERQRTLLLVCPASRPS